jgi:hypothetical protein
MPTEDLSRRRDRRDRNPFLYPVVFGALMLIKAVTKHFFLHPGWVQIICVVALGLACSPVRPKPAKSFFLYLLAVGAVSIGYAYPDAVWEAFRHVLSRL